MTRLFLLLYLGVLATLFAAWYIYGQVTDRRRDADRARVVGEAHGGGARMVARELDAAGDAREDALAKLDDRFDYGIRLMPVSDLPPDVQARFARGEVDVSYVRDSDGEGVVAALAGGSEVVRLGPFPNYGFKAIEDSLAGWIRLTTDKLRDADVPVRAPLLAELRKQFYIPLEIVGGEEVPGWARSRIEQQTDDVVFYIQGEEGGFALSLIDAQEYVRFGPFPQWDDVEQTAATTTLGLVLVPTALAIMLLLRPVALQLRRVEHAAESIAAGDLTTRVDEKKAGSSRPLALAFNDMASRTETLIRTQRELLQAVSHELRTPLSRMRFAIDLVESARDDDERAQRLAAIDGAAEELNELVGELLRYVRMESAAAEIEREPVALHDVLESLVTKFAQTHPHLDFRIPSPIAPTQTVHVDRHGFLRVLGNLLSNAGRFAKHQVHVVTQVAGDAVIVDVDDDGDGIADEDRERVFEPFVRLDNGSSGNSDGFGLGLALVRRIVQQHGGQVDVLTSPLGGCRLRTTWPLGPEGDGHAEA